MNPEEAKALRPGQTLVSGNPNHYGNVSSGLRVLAILENGIQVRRIHQSYFNTDPVETWVIRWDQVINMHWRLLPVHIQPPLFGFNGFNRLL